MDRWNWMAALVAGATALSAPAAWADPACSTCAPTSCGPVKTLCPPFFHHYYEGAPKLKFKRGCPRPICDPCSLPHYGYYQTCWAPWPYPDDWGHCPTPTASQMLPPPEKPLFAPRVNPPIYVPVMQPPKEKDKKTEGADKEKTRHPEDPELPVRPLDPVRPKGKDDPKSTLPDPKPVEPPVKPLEKGPTVRLILSN